MTRRALYVGAFVPDEAARHAGGQAAFQNRRELERLGFAVTSLICSTERSARAAVTGERHFRQTAQALAAGWLASMLRSSGISWRARLLLDTRANIAFERCLRRELARGGYEVVFVDFTQAFLPVQRALAAQSRRPLLHLCIHDLYVQKLLRNGGAVARWTLAPVVRAEKSLLTAADRVVTLSAKDQSLAMQLYDCPVVDIKPFCPPAWVARVRRDASTIAPHEILFFANFGRAENAEALAWFADKALGPLARRFPDFLLVVAGAGSDTVPIRADERFIRRTGFVEDPSALYSRCAIAVAPLAHGAGVKFKVLEALAAGVPVLGTAVALEGVPPTALANASSREAFSDRLIDLLS